MGVKRVFTGTKFRPDERPELCDGPGAPFGKVDREIVTPTFDLMKGCR